MAAKPTTAAGYRPEHTARVRATLLYIATKIGDLLDEVVVIGGLVPSLLIDAPAERHAGTMDLDLGLTLGLLSSRRYMELAERLRRAGFHQDSNERGNATRQRWIFAEDRGIAVDFLVPPSLASDRGGQLRDLELDFAAIIVPGLHLAFLDRARVAIEGLTLRNESARREIWVCGPGAFVVLKALAFRLRGENKDAYDLYHLVRNFERGPESIVERFVPLATDPTAQCALEYLRDDFARLDSVGPKRVAEFFLANGPDDEIQADACAFISRFLEAVAVRR